MNSRPDPLGARSAAEAPARKALAGTRFAAIDWVVEVGSTNTLLLEAAADGAPDGTVLVTDHQTRGRGTKGRTWFDPPGGSLLVSVLVRPDIPLDGVHRTTLAFGLAAVEAIRGLGASGVGLKWPNDVFATVDGPDGPTERKLAGVLAESRLVAGRVDAVVIGMGMNVRWPDEVPADIAATGVSLDRLLTRPVDRADLLVAILRRFALWIDRIGAAGQGDATALLDAYRAASCTLGRTVRLELPGGTPPVVGRAVDVTVEGHLVLEVDGVRRTFASADVEHLRDIG
jgi:BirA family biotin operon repressor/biotin-[acetyl-CoA-carboxylase] ligase